ncbi:hypothetical protein VTK56DRAFT_4400 [Thermocarpiscus australiensis]
MAEAMAVALACPAAFAAVVQLASYGSAFATTLYQFAQDAPAAREEIEGLANRVRSFSSTIRVARDSLSRHWREYPESDVARFAHRNRVVKMIKHCSKLLRRRLRHVEDKLESMRSRSTLWTSIKWALNKSSILSRWMLLEMQGLEADLNLLMTTANMEALSALRRQMSPTASETERRALRKEMRSLRHAVKDLVETISRLQLQLDELGRPGPGHENSRVSGKSFQSRHAVFIELGRSMYKHGVPPDIPPTTPEPSERDSREERFQSGQSAPDGKMSAASSPSTPDHPDRASSGSVEGASSRDGEDSSRNENSHLHWDSPLAPRSTSPTSPSVGSETTPTTPDVKPPTDTYIQDRPQTNALYLGGDDYKESISGYVISSTGQFRSATAVVHETLDRSVISIYGARILELIVQPLGTSDSVILDLGPGTKPHRSIGTVALQWQRSPHPDKRYPPLTVECHVSEHCRPALTFGRPFVDEMTRLWRRSTVAGG